MQAETILLFQVELECYDFAGNKLATYTKVLADYRNGKNEIPLLHGHIGLLIKLE